MRKLIIPIILLLGLVFIFINIAEVQEIVETLQRGELGFIILAFGIQLLWTLNVAASYHTVYRAVGLDEKLAKLYVLVLGANFLNVIAPSGGVGGIAVFISEARRRGYSSARVTVSGALVVLFDYIAFLFVLFLGLVVLFRRNNLTMTEIIPSIILLLVALVLGTLIYLGIHSESALAKALAWMAHRVNRFLWFFIHREYLSEQRAYSFAHEAADGLSRLRQKPRDLLAPFALGLSSKALLIFILCLVMVAFKIPFSVGTLIGGFSIAYLFLIVSPTPAGIGVVEGAMTLGLTSLNIPLGAATVVTLAYRGITFWAPLLFGFIAIRWLDRKEKQDLTNE
jgi:uncharacterized protein (TIRG00374 family)